MLDYIFSFFAYIISTILAVLKFLVVKALLYLILTIIFFLGLFIEIVAEVTKQLIQSTNFSQYFSNMFSYLPPEVVAFLNDLGLIDVIIFVLLSYIAAYFSRFIPVPMKLL